MCRGDAERNLRFSGEVALTGDERVADAGRLVVAVGDIEVDSRLELVCAQQSGHRRLDNCAFDLVRNRGKRRIGNLGSHDVEGRVKGAGVVALARQLHRSRADGLIVLERHRVVGALGKHGAAHGEHGQGRLDGRPREGLCRDGGDHAARQVNARRGIAARGWRSRACTDGVGQLALAHVVADTRDLHRLCSLRRDVVGELGGEVGALDQGIGAQDVGAVVDADDRRLLGLAVIGEIAAGKHDVQAGRRREIEANVVARLNGPDVVALADSDDLGRSNLGIARNAKRVVRALSKGLARLDVFHHDGFGAIRLRVRPRHIGNGIDGAGAHALVVGDGAVSDLGDGGRRIDGTVRARAIGVRLIVAVVARIGLLDLVSRAVDGVLDLLDRQLGIRRPEKRGDSRDQRRRHRRAIEGSITLRAGVIAREDVDAGRRDVLRRVVIRPRRVRSVGLERRDRHDVLEVGGVHRLRVGLVRGVVAVATGAHRQDALRARLVDLGVKRLVIGV